MKKRVITSIVGFALLIPFLIFSRTVFFPLALALLSVVAIYELSCCIGIKKCYGLTIPFYILSVALPLAFRFFKHPVQLFHIVLFGILIGILYCFCILIFSREKANVGDVFVFFATGLLILAGFNSILFVRGYFYGGEFLFLLPFLGGWITDTFAYFTGLIFGKSGKHKLIPDVSPNKTVEGSVGGIVFCILFTVLFFVIASLAGKNSAIGTNYILIVLLGLFMSIFAQIGDLAMSVLKRRYGIKDFGKVFPGHGGVLDRFDSVIAVSVFVITFCLAITFAERILL